MNQSIISQLRDAVRKAEQMLRAARQSGDVEAFHSAQVQLNSLKRQLERARRGEYRSLEVDK